MFAEGVHICCFLPLLGGREPGVDIPRTFKQLDIGKTFTIEPRPPSYLSTKSVRET